MDNLENTFNEIENDLSSKGGFFSPKRFFFRFIGLILMSLVGFGNYFCYDNPGALQDNFNTDLKMSTSKFVLLYSVYSWPNVIFCFIGGFLIDSIFGIRLGTILYMGLSLIGQIIFAFGGYFNMFWLMLAGRFLFGIGAESLAVAQNSYAVLWFKGKELNMVFGLQLSLARLGSTVNFLVMEDVYSYVSNTLGYKGPSCIGVVLFISSLTCVMSMICALVLGCMDKRAEVVLKRNEQANPEIAKLSDVKDFRGVFWLVALICVAYYIAIFPFVSLGKVYFIRKYNYEPGIANTVNSLVYSISAGASPFFGFVVDRTGRNVLWVFLSICGSLLAHGLLAFTFVSPYICMIILGLSYSLLASSLWPLIALIVPEHQLGSAYGLAQAVQNLGLAVTSIVCGMIVDYYGYFILEIFFLAWLWISVITAVIIWVSDSSSTGGYLNMKPEQRQAYDNIIVPENSERARLLPDDTSADLLVDEEMQSQSSTQIRNRYLEKNNTEIINSSEQM